VAHQRYEAVRAVIADGETVRQVAARFGVSRKTVHGWLAKYEAGGLEGLADGSHRPRWCPHQMPAGVEVALVELSRASAMSTLSPVTLYPCSRRRNLQQEQSLRAGIRPGS
jgi:transposase